MCFRFPDDANSSNIEIEVYIYIWSVHHSSDFLFRLVFEVTLFTAFNFNSRYNLKKENSLGDLDQFPEMLLSLRHLMHAALFVGIPIVALLQVIDVAISD